MAGEDTPAPVGDGGKPEATKEREGSGGRPSRNRNRRSNKNGATSAAMPKVDLFDGRVDGLKGFIYDCSDNRQAKMFTRTTEEISGYVGREFRSGGDDVRKAVDSLALRRFPQSPSLQCLPPRRPSTRNRNGVA
jgi:hypothetical protein